MARVVERIFGKLDKYNTWNANDPKVDPTINAYIIDWLYGEDGGQQFMASETYNKVNKNGYYDKLKLKLKEATNSIKAINPKAFEVEVENVVKTNNSISNTKKVVKVDEGCIFTYKAPNVTTNMKIGELKTPYDLKISYSCKKYEELFYSENVVKEIENALIKLYASNINPEIVNFDIGIKSGATGYDITYTTKIDNSSDKPYMGIKILGDVFSKNKYTIDFLENKIKSSQNYDKFNDVFSIKQKNISEFDISFYYAVYTKLNLYPKLE
jgi:hypothetical protein